MLEAIVEAIKNALDPLLFVWNLIVGLLNGLLVFLDTLLSITDSFARGWIPSSIAGIVLTSVTLVVVLRIIGR